MKIVKCMTGHYFDQDKHTVCPHCGEVSRNSSKKSISVSEPTDIDFAPHILSDLPPASKIQIISEELDNCGLKYKTGFTDSYEAIQLVFEGENTSTLLRLIFTDNQTHIKLRSNNIAKIPSSKTDDGYRLINELNSEYNFVKFEIDEDNDIFSTWDFPHSVSDDNIGKIAKEMILIMHKIIDVSYPEIMKRIWS